MLKRMTVSERSAVWARQHGFDLQVEAIAQHDVDSKRALVDAQELYASAELRPMPSSSKRRTSPCANTRSTSGHERWRS
jgi:hypothetical protein